MTNEELLAKWAWRINRDIFTWTEDLTLCWLAEHCRGAALMVESGTYMGASAAMMLEANHTGHLWCVDKFMVAGTQKVTEFFLAPYIAANQCELIVGDSTKAAEMLQHLKGRIDFVWVDDGHAEEDLVRDITSFLPLMRPGGILCGHDWEGDNDVSRGVKRTGIEVTIPLPRLWCHIKI